MPMRFVLICSICIRPSSKNVMSPSSSSVNARPYKSCVPPIGISISGASINSSAWVMNLAMGLALGRTLKAPLDQPEGYRDYWQQATWQAQSAGILAGMMPRTKRPLFGLAYLAGLLHNFGDLVLVQVFPPYHEQLMRWQGDNPAGDRAAQEQKLMGFSREQIAARLLENWGMPDEVTLAVRHQADADYSGPHHYLARIVWLGRQLLTARGVMPGRADPVPQSVFEELGLSRQRVEQQFDALVHNRDGIMAMAGMMPLAR